MYRRKSRYLSIAGNYGDEVAKGPSLVIFQEWTDTSTYSYLKFSSTKRLSKLKGILYFTHDMRLTYFFVYIDFYHLKVIFYNY